MGTRPNGKSVTITRLSLSNFRSYHDAIIVPGSGLNILTGENGAGKTNILEAVSLMTPGRGLRNAPLSEMSCQAGDGGFGVAGQLGEVAIGTGTLSANPDRRIVRINGAASPATALGEWVSVVWLTPAMDRLFLDGASERRRMLDRLTLALDPTHAKHANRYEAAMRQRNRLLSDEQRPDPEWLGALEHQMSEHGMAIASARLALIDALGQRLLAQAEGPFARAGLSLEGWRPDANFATQLKLDRARDAAAGRTVSGPHRSDLAVMHLGKQQPAARCSTGEQKALLLGIILAHADLVSEHHARRPILLLDEVAAHLDPVRRAALFLRLDDGGGQVWVTGTEPSLFAETSGKATRFTVHNGTITLA
jgi:DNA replication and repair protein RecF